jgi:hypothetical protein
MSFKLRSFQILQWALCALATVQFIRYYVVSTTFYLNMPRYLAGQERLPFQYRVLPIYLMWPINHSAFLMHHLAHPSNGWDSSSASTPATLAFYLVSLVSFAVAGLLVVQLYRVVQPNGILAPLVYPIFLVLVLWTYVIHIDADFSYPYDMPSLAFFAGGLLAIYTRRYLPLALIILMGTLNRETTLFLIGIYVLDAATRNLSQATAASQLRLRERFSLGQVSWLRVSLLCVVWLAVKIMLGRHFAHNDRSEDYVRFAENLHRLSPRLWPTLFDICGYVLPIVVLLRRRIHHVRFASYLYILPVWAAVMFYTGVILESRIWGELCTLTAVAAALLIEDYILGAYRRNSAIHEAEPYQETVSVRRAA